MRLVRNEKTEKDHQVFYFSTLFILRKNNPLVLISNKQGRIFWKRKKYFIARMVKRMFSFALFVTYVYLLLRKLGNSLWCESSNDLHALETWVLLTSQRSRWHSCLTKLGRRGGVISGYKAPLVWSADSNQEKSKLLNWGPKTRWYIHKNI